MIFISIQNRHINYREFFYVCPKTDILKLNIKKKGGSKLIYLQKVAYFKNNLKRCHSEKSVKPPTPLTKIYNDSLQGLAELGLAPEDGKYIFDDGTSYEVTEYAASLIKKILSKRTISNDVMETTKVTVKPREEKKLPQTEELPEVVLEKDVPDVILPIIEPQCSEQVIMLAKRELKLVNKKDPTDIKDVSFTVIPLSIMDNAVAADIAVICSTNNTVTQFVSEVRKKSITVFADGIEFAIRGQFQNRKFKVSIFPLGRANADYTVTENAKDEFDGNALPEIYQQLYQRTIGESVLTILPLSKINAPSGRCGCIVVQEDDSNRQIHSMAEKEILYVFINNTKYRIYAVWKGKVFDIAIEKAD